MGPLQFAEIDRREAAVVAALSGAVFVVAAYAGGLGVVLSADPGASVTPHSTHMSGPSMKAMGGMSGGIGTSPFAALSTPFVLVRATPPVVETASPTPRPAVSPPAAPKPAPSSSPGCPSAPSAPTVPVVGALTNVLPSVLGLAGGLLSTPLLGSATPATTTPTTSSPLSGLPIVGSILGCPVAVAR